MKYDDAEYQFLAFTNPDTPMEWGGRVIAMYFAWILSRGLASADMADAAQDLATGTSPTEILFAYCDGNLLAELIGDEGNAFTAAYYERDYYSDFEAVFHDEFADTGHPSDDALSIPDTPENTARIARVLDDRFAQWKAGRLATTPGEVFAVASETLAALMATRGLSPATPRDWQEAPELKDTPLLQYWGGDFDGGREWCFFQVVNTKEGVGLHVNLSSRIDGLVRQAWQMDLRPHLVPRMPKPGDLLPLTALLRMASWWPGKVIRSQEGPPAAIVASRRELEELPRLLTSAMTTRGFPLLDRTRTAEGLGSLQQFADPARAVLSNTPTSLVPLLSAERARRPDLARLCDDWENNFRKLTVPEHIRSAGLLFASIIRKRNGIA